MNVVSSLRCAACGHGIARTWPSGCCPICGASLFESVRGGSRPILLDRLRDKPGMTRTTRHKGTDAGSSARAGADRGLRRPRFELYCTKCGHAMAVSIAPKECPACHGSVWQYRPPESELRRKPA